jgi:hypothetical protein
MRTGRGHIEFDSHGTVTLASCSVHRRPGEDVCGERQAIHTREKIQAALHGEVEPRPPPSLVRCCEKVEHHRLCLWRPDEELSLCELSDIELLTPDSAEGSRPLPIESAPQRPPVGALAPVR